MALHCEANKGMANPGSPNARRLDVGARPQKTRKPKLDDKKTLSTKYSGNPVPISVLLRRGDQSKSPARPIAVIYMFSVLGWDLGHFHGVSPGSTKLEAH